MRLYRTLIIAVFLSVLAYPSGSRALDLGLTPSHVFSLWTNINENLIVVAGVVSGISALPAALSEMRPNIFSGKSPADVLTQLVVYRTKLNRLLGLKGLPQAEQVETDGGPITPSDVYLNSGHVLGAQVRWLITETGPEQTVSQFYTRHGFTGKTPNDVFALVDLANRRMDRLLRVGGV